MNDASHTLESLLNERRSCRGFLPTPIAESELARILAPALRAPSNCNTQPWFFHVCSGETIERLRTRLPADFSAGRMTLDFPYDGKYDGAFKQRQHASAKVLYDAMGVQRDDVQGRADVLMRNFSFFAAPHVGFFCLPAGFAEREACDLGMFAQSVMLVLQANGIESCPQTALGFVSDSIREELGIPEDQRVMFGLSFGYPDEDVPANQSRTDREAMSELIKFHS